MSMSLRVDSKSQARNAELETSVLKISFPLMFDLPPSIL